MKKYLLTILLVIFGVGAVITPVFSATNVSLAPVSVSVLQGQIFTLTILINPQGVKNYTTKTELHYPTDLLEVMSFTFANNWIPITQPGYDLVDNTNGVFIKTAGYPSGISSGVIFGTISFLAKESGDGAITLNDANSFVLDGTNQNVIDNVTVQSVVAIAVSSVAQIVPQISSTSTVFLEELIEENVMSVEQRVPVRQQSNVSSQSSPRSLLASVGAMSFDTNVSLGRLVAIIVLVLVGYVIYAIIQRVRRNN